MVNGEWGMVERCCRGGDSFGSWTGDGSEALAALGERIAPTDSDLYGAKLRSLTLLVRAAAARAIRTRRGYGLRVTGYGRSLFRLLPLGNDYAECADCGSGGTRCVGDNGVRNDERSVGRCAVMGDKYATSVPYLAFFTKK